MKRSSQDSHTRNVCEFDKEAKRFSKGIIIFFLKENEKIKKRNQKVNLYRIMKLFFSPTSLFFCSKKGRVQKGTPSSRISSHGFLFACFIKNIFRFLPRPSPCDQVSIFFTNGHGASRG